MSAPFGRLSKDSVVWWANNIKEAAARNSVKEPKAALRPESLQAQGWLWSAWTGGRAEKDETKSLINAVLSSASAPCTAGCGQSVLYVEGKPGALFQGG